MELAKMTIQGDHIRSIIDSLSCKEDIYYQYNSKDVVILMEEEYYMRIESNLMSVYVFHFKDERTVEIEMIAGGGASGGALSWGAETSKITKIAQSLIDICKEKGWEILVIDPEEFKQSLGKSTSKKFMESVFPWFKK